MVPDAVVEVQRPLRPPGNYDVLIHRSLHNTHNQKVFMSLTWDVLRL